MPIADDFLAKEGDVWQDGATRDAAGPKSALDFEHWDTESVDSCFRDPAVVDIDPDSSIRAAVVAWEAVRGDEESFRDYATRRALGFGYPTLRDGQVDALEKLVEYKRDVILIAKTSFGKSLIFQLAPLVVPNPEELGIALILMPLTLLQQNQSDNVMKRGAHLGARCIVLDGDTNTTTVRKEIGSGKYTHGRHPRNSRQCSRCHGHTMTPRTPAAFLSHFTYACCSL